MSHFGDNCCTVYLVRNIQMNWNFEIKRNIILTLHFQSLFACCWNGELSCVLLFSLKDWSPQSVMVLKGNTTVSYECPICFVYNACLTESVLGRRPCRKQICCVVMRITFNILISWVCLASFKTGGKVLFRKISFSSWKQLKILWCASYIWYLVLITFPLVPVK